ncbi:MAG: lactate utilization protein [Candidatus Omnitrophica bacterium]|nr:lactate utilization protein [Candidatus Omnitrophota bacterium]
MDKKIKDLIAAWQKRNIHAVYCQDREEAARKILEFVPQSLSVGFSGSMTLGELEIVERLKERGNKVFDPYLAGISRDESLNLRKLGSQADVYLASANALSQTGELVFFSGYGNRIAGIAYAPKVIVTCGINKITPNLDAALKRAREHATPLNCKRLNWAGACLKDSVCRKEVCLFPEYKRMCCQILIIEAEVTPDRLKVILVGESLGY